MYISLINRTSTNADNTPIPEVMELAYGRQQGMTVSLYAPDGHKLYFRFEDPAAAQGFFRVVQEAVVNDTGCLNLGDVQANYHCARMPQMEEFGDA